MHCTFADLGSNKVSSSSSSSSSTSADLNTLSQHSSARLFESDNSVFSLIIRFLHYISDLPDWGWDKYRKQRWVNDQ